jgi:hypothetical protein
MHQNLRNQQVSALIDNLIANGMKVSPADTAMLDAFSSGLVTGRDMLAHSLQFPTIEEYQAWLHEHRDSPINDATADVSIEHALHGFRECLQRWQAVPASE